MEDLKSIMRQYGIVFTAPELLVQYWFKTQTEWNWDNEGLRQSRAGKEQICKICKFVGQRALTVELKCLNIIG